MKNFLQKIINFRTVPEGLRNFEEYASQGKEAVGAPVLLSYKNYANIAQKEGYAVNPEAFRKYILSEFASGRNISIVWDDNFPDVDFSIIKGKLIELHVKSRADRSIALKSLRVRHVFTVQPRQNLILSDCFIGHLQVYEDAAAHLSITNCWFGTITLAKASIRHLEIERGGALSVVTPSADSPNPFTGPVVIRDMYLPREPSGAINPQRLRDIRAHLLKLNNILAAGIFHSAELAIDRTLDKWPNKFFSWLYEVMADYGNSASRPLISLVAITAIMTAICLISGNLQVADPKEAVGWKYELLGDAHYNKTLRALVYSISSILNPLGLLQTKPLLVTTSPFSTFTLAILGLLGTLSIGFLVIAIRRRFKLE